MPDDKKVDVPIDLKKLDHDMSMAPFMGVGKIEYESTYKDFEADFAKEDKELKWMPFFLVEEELQAMIMVGGLIIVETKNYGSLFTNTPGYESRKFKADPDSDYQARFYSWPEIVDTLKLWKEEKFNPNAVVDPNTHCINRNFRRVHIFKHKRGFLFANQFDMIYPDEIMQACIIFGK